jgi:hypothetical protein
MRQFSFKLTLNFLQIGDVEGLGTELSIYHGAYYIRQFAVMGWFYFNSSDFSPFLLRF